MKIPEKHRDRWHESFAMELERGDIVTFQDLNGETHAHEETNQESVLIVEVWKISGEETKEIFLGGNSFDISSIEVRDAKGKQAFSI